MGAQLGGLPSSVGDHRGGLGGAAFGQVGGVGPRAGQERVGLRVGLGQHGGALLLRAAQKLLDARAEPGVGGFVGLAQTTLGVGELAGERHRPLVEAGDLTAGVSQLAG